MPTLIMHMPKKLKSGDLFLEITKFNARNQQKVYELAFFQMGQHTFLFIPKAHKHRENMFC